MNRPTNSVFPSPEDWEWFKQKLEEAEQFPPEQRREWILRIVNEQRPSLRVFATRHGAHLLESVTDELSSSPNFFDAHPMPGHLFDTGDVIGHRYTILRFLGAGGMGEVYEAEDRELDGRLLALKTIRGDLSGSRDAATRFEREIRAALTVSHPNVCRIFDVGRHRIDGVDRLFLTMELLSGSLLSDRVRPATALRSVPASVSGTRGKPVERNEAASDKTVTLPMSTGLLHLPEPEALAVIRQLASGLAAIHSRGIIHRDFKPANVILVREADGKSRAVIMDFGLARDLGDIDRTITQTGLHPGTPAYMAPEQLTGAGPATCATDVYALGVTMHEMLTGRRYEMNGSFKALHRAGISSWLRAVVVGCLQADRAKRFQDAMQVVNALDRRPLLSRAMTAGLVGALVIAIALIAFPPALSTRLSGPPEQARLKYMEGLDALRSAAPFLATSRFKEALAIYPDYAVAGARLAQAWLEMEASGMAKDALTSISPYVLQKQDSRSRDLCEAIRFTVQGQHQLAVPIFKRLADTAAQDEKRNAQIDLAREYERANKNSEALAIWRSLAPASPYASLRAAGIEWSIDQQRASLRYDEALTGFERDHNIEGESEVLYERAAKLPTGRSEESTALLQSVVERARLSHDAYQAARAQLQIAFNEIAANRHAEARTRAEEALMIARRASIEVVFARTLRALGTIMQTSGDRQKAEQYFADAVALSRESRDPRGEAGSLINLADVHTRLGKAGLAETEAQRAIDFYSAGGYTKSAILALTTLARAKREQAKFDEAEQSLGTARRLYESWKSRELSTLAEIENCAAQIERFRGRYPEAARHERDSLAANLAGKVKNNVPYIVLLLAEDLAVLGEFEQAREALRGMNEYPERRADVEATNLTMAFYSNPMSAAYAPLRRLAAGIRDEDDRAAVIVLLLRIHTMQKRRVALGPLLAAPEAALTPALNLESRLHLRLARAQALLVLNRKPEALEALGSLEDFARHELLAWRAPLLASRLLDPPLAAAARGNARQALQNFHSHLGELAYDLFVQNRRDLAGELLDLAK